MNRELMLFRSYAAEQKMEEALLVGRNMVSRKPGDRKGVESYLEYLFLLSREEESLADRMKYLGEAKNVLAEYEKYVRLNAASVVNILRMREEIGFIEESQKSEFMTWLEKKNDANLEKLEQLVKQLEAVKKQVEMKNILGGIKKVSEEIQEAYLTEEQKIRYEALREEMEGQTAKKIERFC